MITKGIGNGLRLVTRGFGSIVPLAILHMVHVFKTGLGITAHFLMGLRFLRKLSSLQLSSTHSQKLRVIAGSDTIVEITDLTNQEHSIKGKFTEK